MTVEDQRMAHNGTVESSMRFLGVFYDNNGMVGSIDSYWLQHSMNVLIRLFQRYGFAANVAKSCTMTCQLGTFRLGMSEDSKDLKCVRLGAYYC